MWRRALTGFLWTAAYAAASAGAEVADFPKLIDALQDKGDRVRWDAILRLSDQGPDAVPHLIAALKHENEHVRRGAARALGQIGPRAMAAAPALIEASDDPDDRVRGVVGFVLSLQSGPLDKSAVPLLVDCLDHRRLGVRQYAIRSLGEAGGAAHAAIPPLMKALRDPVLGAAAARALARIGAKAVPALAAELQNPDAHVRRGASSALARLGRDSAAARNALVGALADRDEIVQMRAAAALGQIDPGHPGATAILLEALGNDRMAEEASRAFVRIGSASIPGLRSALKSDDPNRRVAAASTLCQIGPGAAQIAVPALVEALQNQAEPIYTMATVALGRTGAAAEPAIPALIEILEDPRGSKRKAAADALGRMGRPAKGAVPELARLLADPEEGVRGTAAEALARFGPDASAAVPALVRALDASPELDVFFDLQLAPRLVDALGAIGPAANPAIPVLAEMFEEQPEMSPHRYRAAAALARIDPSRTDAIVRSLVKALGAPHSRDMFWARLGFDFVEPAEALGKIGPAAGAAIPKLTAAMYHRNAHLRAAAAGALGRIDPGNPVAVPILVEAITGPWWGVVLPHEYNKLQFSALEALTDMGPSAKDAIPALTQLLAGQFHASPPAGDRRLRRALAGTLRAIGQ